MTHDGDLLVRLGALAGERFEGEVFRATGASADPLTSSTNGGRWAPPARDGAGVSVLYASFERDGAVAEVASYLLALTPVPKSRPLKVSRLAVTASRVVRLARADLEAIGVDMARYGERDYARTQEIGAALAFLGADGLVAPSARWPCDNLMLFSDNHSLGERLDVLDSEEVDWASWARGNGLPGA